MSYFFISKSGISPVPESGSSFKTLLLYHGLFWACCSLVFFFVLFDSHYGLQGTLHFSMGEFFTWKCIFVSFCWLLLSFLTGILLAIPSFLVRCTLVFKLNRRKIHGQKPVVLIFLTKYIPIYLIILTDIVFVLSNFHESGLILSRFFHNSQFLSKFFIDKNESYYKKDTFSYFNGGAEIARKSNINLKVLVFLPDNILNSNDFLKKTKSIIHNEGHIFLSNKEESQELKSILNQQKGQDILDVFPLSFRGAESKGEKSEYLVANIFLKYKLKSTITTDVKNLTWFDVFLNRLAFSQPHMWLYLKYFPFELVNDSLKWSNIINYDNILLKNFLKKNDFNKDIKNLVFMFTENQICIEKPLFKNYSCYKNNLISEKNIEIFDLHLSQFLIGLISKGISYISIIPFKNSNSEYKISSFFLYGNINNNEMIYTPENFNKNFNTGCNVLYSDFTDRRFTEKIYGELSQFQNNLYLGSEYYFSIKSKVIQYYLCSFREKKQFLIIPKGGRKFSQDDSAFAVPSIIEFYHENKLSPENNNLKQLNDDFSYERFMKNFDVFDIQDRRIIPLSERTYDYNEKFLKPYGIEVFQLIQKIIGEK